MTKTDKAMVVGAMLAAAGLGTLGLHIYDRDVRMMAEFNDRAAQKLEAGCYEVVSPGTFKKGAYGCDDKKYGAEYTVTDKIDGEAKKVILCISRNSEASFGT